MFRYLIRVLVVSALLFSLSFAQEERVVYSSTPFNLSLIDGASIADLFSGGARTSVDGLGVAIISARYDRLRGVDLGGLLRVVEGDADGVTLSLFGGVVGGSARGLHCGAAYNVVDGEARGVLSSSVFNIVDRQVIGLSSTAGFNIASEGLEGVQTAAIFNIAGLKTHGWQSSLLMNVAGADMNGAQTCLGLNAAGGDVRGIQTAGILNTADGSMRGLQTSALANITGDTTTGAQIAGVINISRVVSSGAQIGLINISEENDGAAIGPFSYVAEYGVRPYAALDESRFASLGIRTGNDVVYNNVFLAAQANDPFRWKLGYAIGVRVKSSEETAIALQYDFAHVNYDGLWTSETSFYMAVRALAFFDLFGREAFLGPSLNYYFTDLREEDESYPYSFFDDYAGDLRISLWPGVMFGVYW
jgi:hypothetical protein